MTKLKVIVRVVVMVKKMLVMSVSNYSSDSDECLCSGNSSGDTSDSGDQVDSLGLSFLSQISSWEGGGGWMGQHLHAQTHYKFTHCL